MANRNFGCRITDDIVLKGNKAFVMENQKLRLTILLDRGSDIIELLYKPKDIDFMWRSPVALHKKSDYISQTGDSLGNYLDHVSGGWQEILPNGGLQCVYKNAVYGMHGEISNIPWQYKIIKDQEDIISVTFCITTLRSPYTLEKTITLHSNDSCIYIHEELENLANEDMQLMWGHHPTIGEPFLSEDCKIITNAKTFFTYKNKDFDNQRIVENSTFNWPIGINEENQKVDISKIPKKNSKTADMIYLKDFPKQGEYKILNTKENLTIGMSWDSSLFPYLWMWLVCNGSFSYPWYGRTYNIALEPWTSYPSLGLTEAIKNNSSLKIKAHEIIKTDLKLEVNQE